MIEHTKKLVEDKFTMIGGYEHNAEVCHVEFIFCNGIEYAKQGYAWYGGV
jgi:hypothetical protein